MAVKAPLVAKELAEQEVAGAGGLAVNTIVSAHDREHATAYLETLTVYLREGCRNQACADAMSLHVTTLRYRLARIAELFGVDVETPERRFALELAIRLHSVIDLVGK